MLSINCYLSCYFPYLVFFVIFLFVLLLLFLTIELQLLQEVLISFIFPGDNGRYYCGMRVLSCLCCDGICGPQHGCNCIPCQKLDEEEAARTTAMVEKTIPARRIIDSWLWGPPPCKYIYVDLLIIELS